MTRQPRNDYDDDDDDYFPMGSALGSLSRCVFEIDRPHPEFTGLLDPSGQPIFRVCPPKPPIGFSSNPHVNILFGFDPEEDFFYTSDLGEIEEAGGIPDESDVNASSPQH